MPFAILTGKLLFHVDVMILSLDSSEAGKLKENVLPVSNVSIPIAGDGRPAARLWGDWLEKGSEEGPLYFKCLSNIRMEVNIWRRKWVTSLKPI